jgi:hypothetical protein
MPMVRSLEHAVSAARRLSETEQESIASLILDTIKSLHGPKAVEVVSSGLEELPKELAKSEPRSDIWDVNL